MVRGRLHRRACLFGGSVATRPAGLLSAASPPTELCLGLSNQAGDFLLHGLRPPFDSHNLFDRSAKLFPESQAAPEIRRLRSGFSVTQSQNVLPLHIL